MIKQVFLVSFLVINSFFGAFAHENHSHDEQTASVEKTENDTKAEIKADIKHHLHDAHDFHLFTDKTTGKHYGFPLPVILWDNGLKVFMSSKFHHGESVAQSGDDFYVLHHGHIYKTDASGNLTFDEHGHATNVKPLDLSITKNVFSIILISLVIFLIFVRVAKSYAKSLNPGGMVKFFEPLVLFVRDEIAIPNIGEKHYRKYMGYLLTVFFFIWFLNLVGMTPLGINVTGNIAITFALAFMTFIITNLTGNKTYWMHLFDPLGNSMPLIGKIPIYILLIPIELLGVIIKPFSLMIRLYANISAGHIVLMSLIGLMFIFSNWAAKGAFFGLTLFLSIIELLVAFLQAYIFTMLTALYFGFASAEHHDDH